MTVVISCTAERLALNELADEKNTIISTPYSILKLITN